MNNRFDSFTVSENDIVINALKSIDENRQGFVIVTDENDKVTGVLTDGDIRRGILKGFHEDASVSSVYTKNAKTVQVTDGFESVVELFKNESIKFIPIVDADMHLVNIITKNQMHALLLLDIHTDLTYDFASLDTSVVDHEIFPRPWGFYKTTVLNDYFQAKIISVKPGGQLSLQSHNHREEYWIVAHGNGVVQLDQSTVNVSCGSTIFIPKGARHRLTNTDETESLLVTEVQIGDYFGEDDIIRYEDVYGRAVVPSEGNAQVPSFNANDTPAHMRDIRMFLTDCDGCLTDGGMYYSEFGDELKKYNTRDGMGLSLLRKQGILTGMVTSESVDLNRRRCEKLKMDIYEPGCKDKLSAIRRICDERGIDISQVCYVGDDINDLETIRAVGFGCCPANAVKAVKDAADYVARARGGEGVIREVADLLLK